MVDDDHRGYILELLAAKLLSLDQSVQLVGMSATLSDTEILAQWLQAKFYKAQYRPIPIEEFLVCDNQIYATDQVGQVASTALLQTQESAGRRWIAPSDDISLKNPLHNAVVSLAAETVHKGYGALVFCGSRQGCESTALLVARAMPAPHTVEAGTGLSRQAVVDNLQSIGTVPLDDTLAKTVPNGVAFHHAGLTTEEREVICSAFDAGVLKVLVATCSLAAGVNLPARRVILQGVRMGRELVGPAMLRQMRGRAGRKGKDELGESFVCCRKEELEEVKALLAAELTPISSSLTTEKRGVKRALLEVVATRLATHPGGIQEYVERTLLYRTQNAGAVAATVSAALQDLELESFIRRTEEDCYEATALGQATVASGFSPEDGRFIYAELRRAMQAFVLDTELHIFYTFSPVSSLDATRIDWPSFRQAVESLDESDLRVLSFCGVNPAFINRQANSRTSFDLSDPAEASKARIYSRFFAALQLRDLCNEMPVYQVAAKYNVARGSVQSLAQSCQGFATGTIRFCRGMGWDLLAAVLDHTSDRLRAGARADLLELAQIPFVKSRTARVLWENGYRQLAQVAEADVEGVAQVLLLAQPKRRKTTGEAEGGYVKKIRERAEVVVSTAGRLWARQHAAEAAYEDV